MLWLLILDTHSKGTLTTDHWYNIQRLNEKKTGQEQIYDLQFNRKIEENKLKELHPKQFRGLLKLSDLWVVHEYFSIAQVLNLSIYQKWKYAIVLVTYFGPTAEFVYYCKRKNT